MPMPMQIMLEWNKYIDLQTRTEMLSVANAVTERRSRGDSKDDNNSSGQNKNKRAKSATKYHNKASSTDANAQICKCINTNAQMYVPMPNACTTVSLQMQHVT